MSLEFSESGFRVRATQPSFRFSACAAYQRLSGMHLKEMDVAWADQDLKGRPRLVVVEHKGAEVWREGPADAEPHQRLTDACAAKAIDTLTMLSALWLPTPWGEELAVQVPKEMRTWSPQRVIKLVFVID